MSLTHLLPRRSPFPLLLLRTPIPPLTHAYATSTSSWTGRQPSEHVTNRTDELDVQSGASQSGKRARESGDENQSQGTSEKDKGGQNAQAKKDHPEAPGPVIGMNDERGGVSFSVYVDGFWGLLTVMLWKMGHKS